MVSWNTIQNYFQRLSLHFRFDNRRQLVLLYSIARTLLPISCYKLYRGEWLEWLPIHFGGIFQTNENFVIIIV